MSLHPADTLVGIFHVIEQSHRHHECPHSDAHEQPKKHLKLHAQAGKSLLPEMDRIDRIIREVGHPVPHGGRLILNEYGIGILGMRFGGGDLLRREHAHDDGHRDPYPYAYGDALLVAGLGGVDDELLDDVELARDKAQ